MSVRSMHCNDEQTWGIRSCHQENREDAGLQGTYHASTAFAKRSISFRVKISL